MHKNLLLAFLTVTVTLAGCLGDDEAPEAPEDPVMPARLHALANMVEPEGLDAPSFDLFGPIDTGGEPSIWAHLDGTLYLSYPGCAQGNSPCRHGPVYRSDDEAATWTLLNHEADQRLTPDGDGPNANGDADVTVDAAGNVYTSDLGSGIQFFRSQDRGDTWEHMANVVPDGHWADRQWMAAYGDGQVVMTWMGGENSLLPLLGQRAVAVRTTLDGGETWTPIDYLGTNIGWLGTAQFSADGRNVYIPYTQPRNAIDDTATVVLDPQVGLFVARSTDGGMTWSSIDTGHTFTKNPAGTHWAGSLMAPALDVTGDGLVVVAWSEETLDPQARLASVGAQVQVLTSADNGTSWSGPVTIIDDRTGIMPWITAGAGDRIAINAYTASDVLLDSDYQGTWDVEVAIVDGLRDGTPQVTRSVVATGVHAGGICSRGGFCGTTLSDRSFLDFFESDLLPDGRLVIVYNSDAQSDRGIHVAVQTGGTPLAVTPPVAAVAA